MTWDRTEWYQKNKDRLNRQRRDEYSSSSHYRKEKMSQAQKYRVRNQEIVRKFKLAKGCQKCGFSAHHVALELHHRDPKAKEFKIGCTTCSLNRLMAEIDKCEVLCSNCHKIHHFETGWVTERRSNV